MYIRNFYNKVNRKQLGFQKLCYIWKMFQKNGQSILWDGKPNVSVYSFLKMLLSLAEFVNDSFSHIKYGVWILPQQSCSQAFSVNMSCSGKCQVHVNRCICVCVCIYLYMYVCVCLGTFARARPQCYEPPHLTSSEFQISGGLTALLS